MSDSLLYLSDMGGFPRAGEPVLMCPDGLILIGIRRDELRSTGLGDAMRGVYYRAHNNFGVDFVADNTNTTGTSAFAGFSINIDGVYTGFLHATGASYNAGAAVYTSNACYMGGNVANGMWLGNEHASGKLSFYTGGAGTANERFRMLSTGRAAFAGTAAIFDATAYLHLAAGTAAANTAPLKFNSGTLNSTAEAGAVEFLTDKFYATITTSAARKELTLNDIALTSTRVPFVTTNGRLTDNAFWTYVAPDVTFSNTANSPTRVICNAINGTAAYSIFMLQIAGTQSGAISSTGSSWSASSVYLASQVNFISSQSNGMNLLAEHASGMIRLVTGGSATTNERMRITESGLVNIGEPQTPVELLHLYRTTNAQVALRIETTSTGTTARASVRFYTSTGTLNGVIFATSSGWTTTSTYDVASMLYIGAQGAGGLALIAENASGKIVLVTGGTTTARLTLSSAGNVVVGNAALATTATDGYFYITSCAGVPTGVPTTFTGRKALQWDSTNSKLYVYEGGWVAMN